MMLKNLLIKPRKKVELVKEKVSEAKDGKDTESKADKVEKIAQKIIERVDEAKK